MIHEKFTYKSLDEMRKKAKDLGIYLPFAEDTHVLKEPLEFGNITLMNRMGIAKDIKIPQNNHSVVSCRHFSKPKLQSSCIL